MNIFISPDSKRKGIASTLLSEAIKRYNVDLRQQRYSAEGAAFVNNFVRRLPENSGPEIAGNMATVYDKLRYSKSDVNKAIAEVYSRGIRDSDSIDILKNEYGISMGMTDWQTRISRLRRQGIIDSFRQQDKKKKRKVALTATAKFRKKRNAKILQLAKSNPNLNAKQIAERINNMPTPPGVAVGRINTRSVQQILRASGLGRKDFEKS